MKSRNPHTWMWAEACEMLAQADRLHRQFFALGSDSGRRSHWEPPIDVIESQKEIQVIAALPGVEAGHIRVSFDGAALIVEAIRPQPVRASATAVHRLEIPYGCFERRIPLPNGRYELVEQSYANGCLTLRLVRLNREAV